MEAVRADRAGPAGGSDAGVPRGATPPRSLYVHFPFCWHRCHYCDFSVARSRRPPVEEWLRALEGELGWWFSGAGWEAPLELETLYVGGGTPSLLGPSGMDRLASLLSRWFRWHRDEVEWSAEANPASLDRKLCEAWRRAGVNRVSVGVQSFEDGALRWLGRLHGADEARRAVAAARAAGFRDVNLDLIFGLPEEVRRDWRAEVRGALEAGASHVSAYGLTAEPRTPLGRRVERGWVRLPGEERYEREYRAVSEALCAEGWVHYEVSNFARPGRECRHNWRYWDGSPYLGIGPSAHSYFPPHRSWNVFRWDAYRKAVSAGDPPLAGVEEVSGRAATMERVWLGLRTRAGLATDELHRAGLGPEGIWRVRRWIGAGWLTVGRGRVRATLEGWLRLDELTAELAACLEGGGVAARRRPEPDGSDPLPAERSLVGGPRGR